MQGWTRTDPEAAAAFLGSKVTADPNLVVTDSEAIDEICFSRPELTAEWLSRLPAGSFQTTTAGTLARTWSRFDPEAANDWAQSLPEGPPKDAAVEALGKSSRR